MILPIDRKINDRTPYATYALIAINTAILLVVSIAANNENHLISIYKTYGYVPDHFQAHSILTHMFMHGGGFHLVANMVFLGFFGLNVERRLGPFVYLSLYLLSGFTSLGLFLLMDPTGDIPLVGASGAISGVTGMYLALYRGRLVSVFSIAGPFQARAVVFVLFWAGIEVFYAIVMSKEVMVAHWAHVGGFLGGVCAVLILMRTGFKGHPENPHMGPKNLSATFTQLKYIPASKQPLISPNSSFALLSRHEEEPPSEIKKILPKSTYPHVAADHLDFPEAEKLQNTLEELGFPCALFPQKRMVELPVLEIANQITINGHIGWEREMGTAVARDPDFIYFMSSAQIDNTLFLCIFLTSPWTEVRISEKLTDRLLFELAIELRRKVPKAHLSPGFVALSEMKPDQIPTFQTQQDLDKHHLWILQEKTVGKTT